MDLSKEWYRKEALVSEEEQIHRTTNEENNFFQAVCKGDINAVRKNCEEKRFQASDGVGILSRNPVTNMKYHFVISVALITRLCSNNEMEMEQAFRLSDFYILKLDYLNAVEDIVALHDKMVLDFTGKMRLLRKNAGTSKPITACLDYIYIHIKERITIEDLAAHTDLSPSYLSRLFKEEIGISVSDYIREQKIEKAQHLLKFCDYSLIDIANYLSFSSQSHFIQTFRKLTGMTPKKYRDLNYSSAWELKESYNKSES